MESTDIMYFISKMIRILHHLLLLSFLLNWEASSALLANPYNRPHRPIVWSPCFSECSANQTLPSHEVLAFQSLLMNLGYAYSSVDSLSCRQSGVVSVNNPLKVECYCPSDGTQCHIQRIRKISSTAINGLSSGASSTIGQASGNISSKLADLKFLQTLDLSDMGLQSSIPDSLGYLRDLQYLDLSHNKLSGNLPKRIGELKSLTTLDLSYNQLTGGMAMIDNLSSLLYLDLSYNLLDGWIPSLKNLVDLTSLILRYNKLEGEMPDALGNQILKLEYLAINENRLNGTLHDALGNLTQLTVFDVGSNYFTGKIPDSFHQLTSLEYFGVYGNSMNGTIPDFFTNWPNLTKLVLVGNNFEGPLPAKLFMMGNLYVLSVADLVGNQTSSLPPTANFTRLATLILRNCSITGEVPPSYFKDFVFLNYVDLSFNNLYGNLHLNTAYPIYTSLSNNTLIDRLDPTEICKGQNDRTSLFINSGGRGLKQDGKEYAADNGTDDNGIDKYWSYSCEGYSSSKEYEKNLSCAVNLSDKTLYATARVCPISLTYRGFCFRNGQYNVSLRFTELEYVKNEDYSSLRKRIFDVYVQDMFYQDFDIVKAAGGPDVALPFVTHVRNHTLNIRLYWAGKGTMVDINNDVNGVLISSISVTPVVKKPVLNSLEIAFVALACIVFLGIIILVLAWQQGWIGDKELYEKRIDIRGKKFTVKQLIKATQNFSHKKEIGVGGFGAVYKAELGGQVIAVKKLSPRSRQGILEFRRELYSLKSLRHPNFVELLDGYSGHGFHLLIYEYMENKSIADVLFDPNSKNKLNWEIRYKICKDIAIGLKYLHEESHLNMIHGDIKASNILLDSELNAKISDFGLAKIYTVDDQATVVKIGGTTGYMAPEYASKGILSHKTDVYSFGVVLLEIISGRKNSEYKSSEESEFLLDNAYVLHKKGKSMNLVDEDLRDDLSEKESHEAKSALLLAMMCVSLSPSLRPKMSEVVSVLNGEKTIQQVSNEYEAASASRSIGNTSERLAQRNWSSTNTPDTTDVSSTATTTYFVIKENDGRKDQLPGSSLEISHDTKEE